MDSSYTTMVVICMGGAIVGLIVIAKITMLQRIILAVALIYGIYLICIYIKKVVPSANNTPIICASGPVRGELDVVSTNEKQKLAHNIGVFTVETDEDLNLSGWMASTIDTSSPPDVFLMGDKKETPDIHFNVKSQSRPDVGSILADPLGDQCGFIATVHVPADILPGRYKLCVEKNARGERQYIYTALDIMIVERKNPKKDISEIQKIKETKISIHSTSPRYYLYCHPFHAQLCVSNPIHVITFSLPVKRTFYVTRV
jgi:hypothetical protein